MEGCFVLITHNRLLWEDSEEDAYQWSLNLDQHLADT